MLDVLKPLWAYRGFVLGSVRREFQSRYRNSLLGAAWTVIQPLAMITVYTVIFAQVMRARLAEWIDRRPRHQLHWVLKDINFAVRPGEALGIIGINGAGKSTLLKMIAGTTRPTTGSVHTTGRVSALLELGMGFHPDFTGRQNASALASGSPCMKP